MQIIKIGRDTSNDYVLQNPMVSGFHGDIFMFDDGSLQYQDHSTNGTMIGGEFIKNQARTVTADTLIGFPGGINIPVSSITGPVVPVDPPKGPRNTSPFDAIRPNRGMNFGQTFVAYFNQYVDFSTRARRKEYWFICLWNMIFGIIPVVNILWALATFIPGLAITVRRLHDIGKSGWFILFNLIPLVGWIFVFVWTLTDSERQTNEYGRSPKYDKSLATERDRR